VILVISIILGTAVNPICFAGAVIATLLCIAAFGSNKTSKTAAAGEEEVRKAEENLRFAESEGEKEEQAAFEAEEKARKVLKELEARVELLESEVAKLQKQYNDSSLRLSRVKQEFSELQFKLKFIGEKVSAAEEEVACEKNELDELI
jgi:predicted nuclease with TOPRIM domain